MKLLAIGYVLSWIATSGQAAPGGGPWYAPLTCGSDKTSLLGTSSDSAMMGTFEFAPGLSEQQRLYVRHWIELVAHCEISPDKLCDEVWHFPCEVAPSS